MQINLNSDKGNLRRHATESDVNPQLQAALAEREKFLMRYPHMRSYQAEIDRILDKSGNAQGRMAVLGMDDVDLPKIQFAWQKEIKNVRNFIDLA